MNILAKLMTALRGGANEAGEAIIDAQALRILDQEVRDAAEELKHSKDALAEIIARQKVSEEKAKTVELQITEHETNARKALNKGEESLALEVAAQIVSLESQRNQEASAADGYKASAEQLRNVIKTTEQNLKRMKQQIDTVKATESVQRAQAAVANRHSGSDSKMRTAMDSLERIQEKQAMKAAQMDAASEISNEMSESSLQSRLEEAGIGIKKQSAEDILARLKAEE